MGKPRERRKMTPKERVAEERAWSEMTPEQRLAVTKIWDKIVEQRSSFRAIAFMNSEELFQERALEYALAMYSADALDRPGYADRIRQLGAAWAWLRIKAGRGS